MKEDDEEIHGKQSRGRKWKEGRGSGKVKLGERRRYKIKRKGWGEHINREEFKILSL
jgi:hypothetical protein